MIKKIGLFYWKKWTRSSNGNCNLNKTKIYLKLNYKRILLRGMYE